MSKHPPRTTSLVQRAREEGWYAAAQHFAGSNPTLLRYMLDERAADWRFLLPDTDRNSVLCVGGGLSAVPLVLARQYNRVVVAGNSQECAFLLIRARQEGISNIEVVARVPLSSVLGKFPLVAALRREPGATRATWRGADLQQLAGKVTPGGMLYLEADVPAVTFPPALLAFRLRRLGIRHVSCFWPKPDFDNCELILPLGDPRLQHYYLSHLFFASSPLRRALRVILGATTRMGAFEWALPGYMAVCRREAPDGC